jgi:hypothetical protein
VTTHCKAALLASAALLALAAPAAARAAAGLQPLALITADDKEAPLHLPEGVACGGKGVVVVADSGNGRLLTFTWREGRLEGGAPIKLAEAPYPVRVQIDSRGNVVVLDRRTRRLVKVDTAGRYAGVLELRGAAGPAPLPLAFRIAAEDRLVVLDGAARRVLLAGPEGRVGRELPLPPGGAFTDVGVDGAGRILAVDAAASRLWVAEKDAKGFRPLGEPLKDRVSFPGYVAEEGGRLVLVDQNGHGLAMLGADGRFLGRELELGWGAGRVSYPGQVCGNGAGQLFLADRGNDRIQVLGEAR